MGIKAPASTSGASGNFGPDRVTLPLIESRVSGARDAKSIPIRRPDMERARNIWPHEDTLGSGGSAPLRVLLVTARYLPYIGGTEIHTYEVARRLVAAGHQVTVLTTDPSQALPQAEWTEEIEVLRVPAWPADRDYYFAPRIHRTVQQARWDVVHCQGYHTFVA